MHVHILGIAGTFMGGVAAIAKEAGFRVTGADLNVYPPMSTQLTALGIEFIEGYGAEQLDLRPDVVVVGNALEPRRSGHRGDARPRHGLYLRAAMAGRAGAARTSMCWRWPARTARPRPRACWRGSWSTPGSRRDSSSAACRAISIRPRGWALAVASSSKRTSTTRRSSTSAPNSFTIGRAR